MIKHKIRKISFWCIFSAIFAVITCCNSIDATVDEIADDSFFIRKSIIINDTTVKYALYVPKNYAPDSAWPLIIFQHGSDRCGTDGLLQTTAGLGPVIRANPEWFPCLVLFPQNSSCDYTTNPWKAEFTKTVSEYSVDPGRIYMTGLSLGGAATWFGGGESPELFAALMPLCGWGNTADAVRLAAIPIFAFHSSDDPMVPVSESRAMVNAIKEAGGTRIQYTELSGYGHKIWEFVYNNRVNIDWMLHQKKANSS